MSTSPEPQPDFQHQPSPPAVAGVTAAVQFAAAFALGQEPLDVALLIAVNSLVTGEGPSPFRSTTTTLGVPVKVGDNWVPEERATVSPADIESELRYAFSSYNGSDIEARGATSEERAMRAANCSGWLLARIVRCDPFPEGNLGTAYAIFQCALSRFGFEPLALDMANPLAWPGIGGALTIERKKPRTIAAFANRIGYQLKPMRTAGS
jgi:hypothetical protein